MTQNIADNLTAILNWLRTGTPTPGSGEKNEAEILESIVAALGAPVTVGGGNTYWVIKSTEAHYAQFLADHPGTYSDGSAKVYTDIQSALDACVDSRNDYVKVMPSTSDYDITAALTLSKKAVHLICPAGFGYTIGANNACRIHQNGAFPIMVVSASAVEIAGFYLKNYATKGAIICADGAYGLSIHNNYFAMNLNGVTNEPMIGPYIADTTGDTLAWSTIERNFLQSQAGANATIAAIIRSNQQATGTRIEFNEIQIGDTNNTATRGIQCLSVKGIVNFNILEAAQTNTGAGVFTKGIEIDASGSVMGNMGAIPTGNLFTGGTDEISAVNNVNGVNGGTIADDST